MVYLTDPATAVRDREAVRRLFHNAEGLQPSWSPKTSRNMACPDRPTIAAWLT